MSEGGVRPGALAEQMGIAPRTATEIIDQLESKKLVKRTPDPHDRRALQVQATSEGNHRDLAVQAARSAHSQSFLAALSPEEQGTLAGLLEKLESKRG